MDYCIDGRDEQRRWLVVYLNASKECNEMISQAESEAYFNAIFKIAPVSIFHTDSEGKCLTDL